MMKIIPIKRAREEGQLEKENKLTGGPLNSFFPFTAELGETQRRKLNQIADSYKLRSNPPYIRSRDGSDDEEEDEDRMVLDCDSYTQSNHNNPGGNRNLDENNSNLFPSSHGQWSLDSNYPPRPRNANTNTCSAIETDDSRDPHNPLNPNSNQDFHDTDSFIHVLKGGKPRYIRKIDYLVDDLIRKTNRTLDWVGNNSELSCIPSSIGPHPLTDIRMLSVSEQKEIKEEGEEGEDTAENGMGDGIGSGHIDSGAFEKKDECKENDRAVMKTAYALQSITLAQRQNQQQQKRRQQQQLQQKDEVSSMRLAGDVTHSDWPIEELTVSEDGNKR